MSRPLARRTARLGVLVAVAALTASTGTAVAGAAERPAPARSGTSQAGAPVMVGPATGLEPATGKERPAKAHDKAPKARTREAQASRAQAAGAQAAAPRPPQAQQPQARQPQAQQPQARPRALRLAAPQAVPAAAVPGRPPAADTPAGVQAGVQAVVPVAPGISRAVAPTRRVPARLRVVNPVPIGPRVPVQAQPPLIARKAQAAARPRPADSTVTIALTQVPGLAAGTAQAVARTPGVPLGLIAIVLAFLLLQSRIDGRDPKLGLAPVEEDEPLEFAPAGIVHLRLGSSVEPAR